MEELGHQVIIDHEICPEQVDLLVAFNACKNRRAIIEAKQRGFAGRIIVCLTGTDLYFDLQRDPGCLDVLKLSERLVVLQPMALDQLLPAMRSKTQVIFQSAVRPTVGPICPADSFDICVIAHLRGVKDPLRAAMAARLLPAESKIRVILIGKALTEEFGYAAEKEAFDNERFLWLGEQSRENAAQILLRSRMLVLSSLLEGGANVLSEAIVSDIPVIVTKISCTVGLLGEDYPGFFPVGDTVRLAELMSRAEVDYRFYNELRERCRREAYKFDPEIERERIKELLAAVAP
jgi:putative glycosyltransferase (TIGR04348 family)